MIVQAVRLSDSKARLITTDANVEEDETRATRRTYIAFINEIFIQMFTERVEHLTDLDFILSLCEILNDSDSNL